MSYMVISWPSFSLWRLEPIRKGMKELEGSFVFNNSLRVEAHDLSGGLFLLWSDYYDLQIVDSCSNYIHAPAKERRPGFFFNITFVYGNPIFSNRRSLWPSDMT